VRVVKWSAALVVALCGTAWVQELPNRVNVDVGQTCTFDQQSQNFTYRFSLYSKPTSAQRVCVFVVECPEKIVSAKFPTNWFGFYRTGVPTVPNPIMDWGAKTPAGDVPPGGSLHGFELQSAALPGIAKAYLRGFVPIPKYYPGAPDVPRFPDNSVRVYTVAAVGKATMTPPQAIDYIVEQKHQAADLGWISKQGIVVSLDQKLESARQSIQRSNNAAARNVLNAFVNELDAQKGKSVNDAAYNLLRANADWLLAKLR
jgi:hypothetical protein